MRKRATSWPLKLVSLVRFRSYQRLRLIDVFSTSHVQVTGFNRMAGEITNQPFQARGLWNLGEEHSMAIRGLHSDANHPTVDLPAGFLHVFGKPLQRSCRPETVALATGPTYGAPSPPGRR